MKAGRGDVPDRARRWHRTHVGWVAAPLALFLITFGLLTGQPVGHADEAWFLWVLTRVNRGDTLYRDVYFVSTPLPAWLGAAAVRVFGSQVLVTRALTTACFTASTVLGWVLARRCGVGRVGQMLLVVALFAYGSPLSNFVSFYSCLAVTLALAALLLLLSWVEHPSAARQRRLVGAGGLAGLSFAAKPNVGVALVGVILVVVIGTRGWRRVGTWLGDAGRTVAPWLAVAATVVGAVAATGATTAFGAQVFAGKTHYLDAFTGGYLPGLQHFDEVLPWVGPPAETYANRLWLSASLLPIVAVAVAGAAVVVLGGRRRLLAATLGLGALVGVVGSIPRGGPQHLAEMAPIFVTAAVASGGLLGPALTARPVVRLLAGVLAVWLSIAVVAVVWRVVEPFGHRGESLRGLPHVVGALSSTRTRRNARLVATELGAAHVTSVFIVRLDAAFYYLVDHVKDPTPYDFPGVSDLGADDQDGVIRLLRTGSVRWVCVPRAPGPEGSASPTRPLRLESFVRHHFVWAGSVHICSLYRPPGAVTRRR